MQYRQLAACYGFTSKEVAEMTPAQVTMYLDGPPPGAAESVDERTGKRTATFSTMNEARAFIHG